MSCVAIVTGGLGGIGSAICEELLDEGYSVVAVDIENPEAEARWVERMKETGRVSDSLIISANVAKFEDAKGVIDEVESRFNLPLSILVNAAGITDDKFAHKMDPDQWQKVIDINLTGAFNMMRAVLPGMRERGFGRIVNISSVNGQKGQAGQINYAASKSGLHGATMSVAQENAAKGVTANSVSPGYIRTPMTAKMKPEVLDSIKSSIPAGDLGIPEDIANVVSFLTRVESGYITGANVPVNGGLFTSF